MEVLSLEYWALALVIALVSGFVKGVVGFAMPTIFISGLSSFMAPELALAGLILPTLISNVMQALRQGIGAAWRSAKRFWRFLLVGGVMLAFSAQLVTLVPDWLLYLAIGVPVVAFTALQLLGWRPSLSPDNRVAEILVGIIAGFVGGLSGIWGPQTVMYLTAMNTPKLEQMRTQGVVFGLGAVVFFLAHLQSGVLTWPTIQFSMALVLPAVLGIWLGFKLQDRFDQDMFRKITSVVLLIAGLNLIRRAVLIAG